MTGSGPRRPPPYPCAVHTRFPHHPYSLGHRAGVVKGERCKMLSTGLVYDR